jgi:[acyl-carrier-protein] S-malonyltransferase
MGRGLLDPGGSGHDLAQRGSELIGLDLAHLACEADEDEVRATEVAQPLLLLHSAALLELFPDALRSEVAAVAGHSLGEYTALMASGALGFEDAIQLVRERGLAMAAAGRAAGGKQGMSAVLGMDEGEVDGILRGMTDANAGQVVIANINAPGQVVISGDLAAIEQVTASIKAAGARRVMPLAVAGAFHSPFMADAAERLAAALDTAPIVAGSPQAFNVDGQVRTEAVAIRDALRRQLTAAVRWTDCVASLCSLGVNRFIELGPGSTLTAMGKRIDPGVEWVAASRPDALAAL